MKYLLLLLLCMPVLLFSQTTEETMMHDGENRSYFVHLPPQYDGSTKLPVVFVLHGIGGTASSIMLNTGFNTLGDQEGFISIYPQGLESALGAAWNNGSNLSLSGFAPDDLGFISAVIDQMVNDYSADNKRIYSCGFSMGGIMSHYLGCNLSDKITAIASQAGTMANSVSGSCNPDRAVPVLHIHGDADGTVEYGGNTLYGLNGAVETVEVWATANNCSSTPTETALPDSQNDGFTVTKADYTPCENNSEVILMTVHGADHIWLGLNNDIATTIEFWNFFSDKVNEDATSPVNETKTIAFSIFPNPAQDIISISGLDKEMDIQVTDIAGKLLIQTTASDFVDVSALKAGTYLVQISDLDDGGSSTQKFMKL